MGEITFSRLTLCYITGYDGDGEPIFTNKHYRNISPDALSASLYQVATALASLQKHDLDVVERNNTYEIIG